jgi:hypothetical protein
MEKYAIEPGRNSLGSISDGGLLTGESPIPLFRMGFVIPGGSLSQRVGSLCPDFLTGDGTLGTEYRLRGEREKVSGGVRPSP